MPTLQFKGKNIIWNHHLSVPYHTLEEVPKLHFKPDKSNGNLIIEGDNLLALKALLPMYAGKVKVACIDPPYNIGTEGWAYNDNVNSPLIRDWFGKKVGIDDLTRHDKWLCMMTPRLKLLRELLSDDGVIFVNIDENEEHHLRSLMDEVFGETCFIEKIIWNKRIPKNDKGIGNIHEYVLLYAKNSDIKHRFAVAKRGIEEVYTLVDKLKRKKLPISEAETEINKYYEKKGYDRGITLYNNLNENYRLWGKINVSWPNSDDGPRYDVLHPTTKKPTRVPDNGWRWKKETFDSYLDYKNVKERYDGGFVCGQIWFAQDERTQPSYIKYLDDVNNFLLRSIISIKSSGGAELSDLLPDAIFQNPKTYKLLAFLLSSLQDRNALILDSFSGSGTTGHAVMDLNKEDGGNRNFILVQMTEAIEKEPDKNICKDITRERIKSAIEKYGYDSGFKYLRVGQALDAATLLEGKLPDYKTFAKYVYYLCTGDNLEEEKKINEKKFFVGTFGRQVVYLIYKQDYEALTKMALNLEIAEKIVADQPDRKCIIYAPACFLDEEYLEGKQIEFVSIPYNLFHRKT